MARRYTRVHRLLRILTLIQSGETWNVKRLAQACGTTPRNIHRDLNMLEGAGVPYVFDRESGGYRVARPFFLPPVDLTLEEALAVICLADQVGGGEQIPFMKSAVQAAVKLKSQLPASITDHLDQLGPHLEVRLAAAMPADGVADVYELVRRAIATKRTLQCRYESIRTAPEGGRSHESEAFTLKPYCLFFGQRAWYVIGDHSGRNALRCLKLNRFSDIQPTKTPFAIPDDFSLKSYLGKAWRMIRGDRTYRVEIHFDAAFAETVADTHWHDTQSMEWCDDGSMVFRCEVAGLDEIVWWVLSMGPHCRVVRPRELADRVADLGRGVAAVYA